MISTKPIIYNPFFGYLVILCINYASTSTSSSSHSWSSMYLLGGNLEISIFILLRGMNVVEFKKFLNPTTLIFMVLHNLFPCSIIPNIPHFKNYILCLLFSISSNLATKILINFYSNYVIDLEFSSVEYLFLYLFDD
jgi:hypothetical protein